MTDTEIIEWLICNASKLGVKPDYQMSVEDKDGFIENKEWTDIRKKVETLAKEVMKEHKVKKMMWEEKWNH